MFSPEKMTRFLVRFLAVLLPALAILFAMGLVTELNVREAPKLNALFWLAVIRDMVPGIIALVAVDLLAARFVKALYKMESLGEARSFVYRCLFGLSKFGPWI